MLVDVRRRTIIQVRSRGLSKDKVATTALRLIGDAGLPDFTMRRLAAALDVQASAIYWHFPNKQTLLAELADRIIGHRPSDSTQAGWDQQLRDESFALREALLEYRDGAEIVASSMALGLGSDLGMVRLSEALAGSAFPQETANRAAQTMLHFVLGYVSLEQQRLLYDRLGARDGDPAALDETERKDRFVFGVNTIVAGLGAEQNARCDT
jgi:AcrR family transcriptional regulator